MPSSIKRRRFFSVMAGLGCLCFGSALTSTVCWGKITGERELLERIGLSHSANREQLATWNGEVLIETYTRRPGEAADERAAIVQFAYDRDLNAWYFHLTYVKSPADELNGMQQAGMFLNGTWHQYMLYRPGSNITQNLVTQPGPPPAGGPMEMGLTPLYYFTVRSQDVQEKFDGWLVHAESEWLTLDIERDMDLVTIVQGNVNIPHATAKYTFDLSKGGNLVSLVGRDDEGEATWNNQWENVSDVWVPKRFVYENKTHDGNHISRRTVTWERNVVNEPLAEGTFTLDTLRVAKGSIITDHRIKRSWRYKEEDRRKDERSNTGAVSPVEDRRWRFAWLAGVNILMLAVVVGFLWRWKAKSGE